MLTVQHGRTHIERHNEIDGWSGARAIDGVAARKRRRAAKQA